MLVLHDRNGSELTPFRDSGWRSASLTDAQIVDVANFLRQRVNDTLRGSPIFHEQDVLTGDAKAGETYFNGDGHCATCHTAAVRSLAGIATRIPNAIDVQQRMLFPESARGGGAGRGPAANPVTVTVAMTNGAPLSGVLVQMDDFFVTLRDASNTVRVVRRVPGMTITKKDPYEAHHDLLDRISDKQIHDLVAYLVTLRRGRES